jgi:hypothetical protein
MSTSIQLTDEQKFVAYLWECGYRDIKITNCGLWAATFRYMYTHAIILGQMYDRVGFEDRWRYETKEKAEAALRAWDIRGEPDGWHRHPGSGRRRPGSDRDAEYVTL